MILTGLDFAVQRAVARRVSRNSIVALMVGLMGHLHGDRLYLNRLNTSPVPSVLASEAARSVVPFDGVRQLWVLFLDGLRPDVAAEQTYLSRLSTLGPSRVLLARFPTFTEPALVTMSTGVIPRSSGSRLNGGPANRSLDRISDVAVHAGYRVMIGDNDFEAFADLLSPSKGSVSTSLEHLFDAPLNQRAMVWLYFGAVDEAGHRAGGRSSAYHVAAQHADALVGRAMAHLDFSKDALIVVSDHGHLDRGGHGGTEPAAVEGIFYAAGRALSGGSLPPIGQESVAATLAALMGQSAPRHAQGEAMSDALKIPVKSSKIDFAPGVRFEKHHERAALVRFGIALIIMIAVLMPLRKRIRWLDFGPWLVFSIVFAGVFYLAGYAVSWSVPRGHAAFVLETALMSLFAFVIAAKFMRRMRADQEALTSAILFGGPYFLLSAYAGLDFHWLPSSSVSFAVVVFATLVFYACTLAGVRAWWLTDSLRYLG